MWSPSTFVGTVGRSGCRRLGATWGGCDPLRVRPLGGSLFWLLGDAGLAGRDGGIPDVGRRGSAVAPRSPRSPRICCHKLLPVRDATSRSRSRDATSRDIGWAPVSKLAHGVVWQAWLPGRRTSTPAYRPSNASKVAVVRALVIRLLSELGSNHAGSKCIRQLAYSRSLRARIGRQLGVC